MNKIEFMRQLDVLLVGLPIHEREEALQYYEDYFADAGEENEQAVIEALGSPAKVAENIKRDLSQSRGFEEYESSQVAPDKEVGAYRPVEEQTVPVSTPVVVEKKSGLSGGIIALIVILCILASPLLLAILGVLIGVGAAWISVIATFGALAISLFTVAVVLVVLGFTALLHSPLVALGVIGVALILAAVAFLFIMLTVLVAWGLPAIISAIAGLFRGKKSKAS